MAFWLVLCSMIRSPAQASNAGPPVALPLLLNLLQEPSGHRLPLPHVPRLCGYVFELSTKWR